MAQTLTESALMAALSFILYIAGYVPILSAFVLLASPLPITWVGVRHGGRQAALAALCTSVVVGLVLGPPDAYLYLVPFGLLGTITGVLIHRDEESDRALVIGSTLLFVAVTPAAMVLEKAMGMDDPMVEMKKFFLTVVTTPLSWTPGLGPDATKQFVAWGERQVVTFARLPLALFLAFSVLLYYANHLASFILFLRLNTPIAPPPDLRRFRMPATLLVAVVLSSIAYVWVGGGNGTLTSSILINVVLAGAFFSYMGGMSLLTRYLDASSLKPLARVGISFVAMFLLFPLLVVLGMADSALPLRDRAGRDPTKRLSGFR